MFASSPHSLGRSVRHSLVVALVAALALGALVVWGQPRGSGTVQTPTVPAANRATSFTPSTGATFNRPLGSTAEQRRIHDQLNRTIDAVPAGATIRVAVFSFSEMRTADALLRARARGAKVQVVADDHVVFPAMRKLRAALGSNPNAGSFTTFCASSCRRKGGDMHDKIFTFSRAGGAEYVTMVGSNNLTSYNSGRQWSDVYTAVNDPALYFTYSGMFDQLKFDRPTPRTYYNLYASSYRSQFFPMTGVTPFNDPVMKSLNNVSCAAGPGTGYQGRTLVRISMHAWFGPRGDYLARRVAALSAAGCLVQVIPGISVSSKVRGILAAAGVQVATVRHKRALTHQKVLTISGGFEGNPSSTVVFTGSQNWTDRALVCDDVILRIRNPQVYAQYAANFDEIWNNG